MDALLPAQPENLRNLVTVGDALGDLPSLRGDGDQAEQAVSAYAATLRNGAGPPNHKPWRHTPELARRLASVPEGGRLATEKRYYSQAYARLHRAGLARTITTNFTTRAAAGSRTADAQGIYEKLGFKSQTVYPVMERRREKAAGEAPYEERPESTGG